MRESGILMPVSSLPGPYGIGCFGKEAFEFVDFLAQAGQKIWQILPLSPTGYGDSPYQSCSAFAGNPYFIDLDTLKEEGLLTAAQLKAEKWGTDPKEVDYGTLYVSRFKVLRTAYAAWRKQCAGLHGCAYYFPDDYYAFTLANEEWLDDYALYMALKVANGMKNWVEWERPYRLRDKAALAAYDEARLGYEQKVLTVFKEANDAVVSYRSVRRTAALKVNLRDAARKYVELAQLQYRGGSINYIDVLDAQRRYFDAQIGVSNAVRDEHLALVDLYKALGGGWAE